MVKWILLIVWLTEWVKWVYFACSGLHTLPLQHFKIACNQQTSFVTLRSIFFFPVVIVLTVSTTLASQNINSAHVMNISLSWRQSKWRKAERISWLCVAIFGVIFKPFSKSFIDQACSLSFIIYWPFFCILMDLVFTRKEHAHYLVLLTPCMVMNKYLVCDFVFCRF